jgi:hypothetical protein
VGSKDVFQRLDLSKIAGFTAGIPSIGFSELAFAALLEDDPQQQQDFLEKGIIALMLQP